METVKRGETLFVGENYECEGIVDPDQQKIMGEKLALIKLEASDQAAIDNYREGWKKQKLPIQSNHLFYNELVDVSEI